MGYGKISLGGFFKHFFISPRQLGKMNPIWRPYFSGGWFNHQLPLEPKTINWRLWAPMVDHISASFFLRFFCHQKILNPNWVDNVQCHQWPYWWLRHDWCDRSNASDSVKFFSMAPSKPPFRPSLRIQNRCPRISGFPRTIPMTWGMGCWDHQYPSILFDREGLDS